MALHYFVGIHDFFHDPPTDANRRRYRADHTAPPYRLTRSDNPDNNASIGSVLNSIEWPAQQESNLRPTA